MDNLTNEELEIYKLYGYDVGQKDVPTPTDSSVTDFIANEEREIYKLYGYDVGEPVEVTPKSTTDVAGKTYTFDELVENKEYIQRLRSYATDRYGASGEQEEGESDREYLSRFLTHVRQFENNSVEMLLQLDYIRNAEQDKKEDFAYLYDKVVAMPDFYEEGGADTALALRDYVVAFLSDPVSLVSGGVGKLAGLSARKAFQGAVKKEGLEEALKIASKQKVRGTAAGVGAVEGAGQAAMTAGVQAIEMEADPEDRYANLRDEYDAVDIAISGALGGTMGMVGGAIAGKGNVKDAVSNIRKEQKTLQDIAKSVNAKKAKAADEVNDTFDPVFGQKPLPEDLPSVEAGRTLLEGISPSDGFIESGVQRELHKKAVDAVIDVLSTMKQQGVDISRFRGEDDKMDDVIYKVFESEEIDTNVLDRAIARQGLTTKDLLSTYKATTSAAAQVMNSKSQLARFMSRVEQLDPAMAAEIKKQYNRKDPVTSAMSKFSDFYYRLDRERRAIMVTRLSTTVRNVATGAMNLTANTAANLLESTMYHAGLGVQSALRGDVSLMSPVRGIIDIFGDALDLASRLERYGQTSSIADALLVNNPALSRKLNRTLSDGAMDDVDQNLSRAARFLNTLNMAQDSFFRKAVFVNSVNKQLKRRGIDFREALALKKDLPVEVLQQAIDDSMKFTFSYMPQEKAGGFEGVASKLIKMNDALGPVPFAPVGTAAIPYARFMANAIRFQYEYSPLNSFSVIKHAAVDGIEAFKESKSVKEGLKGAIGSAKAREDLSKVIVGSAALQVAVQYRAENQDLDWYMWKYNDEGDSIDTRALFPIAPYLYVADVIVKMAEGRTQSITIGNILEGVAGLSSRNTDSAYMINGLLQSYNDLGDGITSEKIAENTGRWLADLTGGFVTPLKMVEDVMATYDPEINLRRTYADYEGVGFSERFISAYTNNLQKLIPGVGKVTDKPVLEEATREDSGYRPSPLFTQITGLTRTRRKNEVEKEITFLGLEYNDIFTSTGDRTADRLTKKYLGSLAEDSLARDIASDYYKSLTEAEKRSFIRNRFTELRKLARIWGETDNLNEGGINKFSRGKWSKVGKEARALADQYYIKVYGFTVEEMQQKEPNTDHYRRGTELGSKLRRSL